MLLLFGRSSFQPTDIPNLVSWHDANDSTTLTDDGGGLISAWTDKSGNGRTYTAAGSARPTYSATSLEGSLPGLSFAAGDVMSIASETLTYTTFTFFMISQRDTDAGATQIYWRRYTNRELQVAVNATDSWRIEGSTTGASTDASINSTVTATAGQKALFQARKDATTLYLQVDSETEQSTAMATINNAANTTDIGRAAGADSLGTISEIIFYTRDLTVDEITSIRTYLTNKWSM